MFDLTTTVIHHDLYRVTPCCLCGAAWDEHWIGVGLVVRGRALGDLCPRCLSSSPKRAIDRVREFGPRLLTLSTQMKEYLTQAPPYLPLPGDTAELQAETARTRARTAQLRDMGQELRAAHTQVMALTRQSLAQLAKLQQELLRLQTETQTLGGATPPVPGLALLEEGLSRLPSWPTKLAEAIRLERACFAQQSEGLSEHEVRRVVDDRYYRFLAQAA